MSPEHRLKLAKAITGRIADMKITRNLWWPDLNDTDFEEAIDRGIADMLPGGPRYKPEPSERKP